MKILITGARGMVGRNIIDGLSASGRHSLLQPSRDDLDLEDREAVARYLADHTPDAVIHAAGKVGGIRANVAHPVEFLSANLRIGTNVIDGAKDAGVRRLLNIASSCMYPRNAPNPLRETRILTGELEPTNEGYAIAKIASTRLCEYISREYPDYVYITLIPCNLYGYYDHFDVEKGHMIAAVMQRMHVAKLNGDETMTIWGDGTARREFMFVGDLAGFVVDYVEHMTDLPVLMNVGLGHDYSINEYYEAIRAVVGYEGAFEHDLDKPVGMQQKLVDITRQTSLGWAPSTSLYEGLRRTYEYYLESWMDD